MNGPRLRVAKKTNLPPIRRWLYDTCTERTLRENHQVTWGDRTGEKNKKIFIFLTVHNSVTLYRAWDGHTRALSSSSFRMPFGFDYFLFRTKHIRVSQHTAINDRACACTRIIRIYVCISIYIRIETTMRGEANKRRDRMT